MNKVSWVITETVNGQETVVWETYSKEHANAILCDYTKQDRDDLLPCIYKNCNGELTTEY